MNEEQITALASEYAEWVTDVSKAEELPNCLLNEANKLIADSAERMLTWLSTHYCLVEKSKAIQIYQAKRHILANQDVFGISTATEAAAQKRLMLCLFPEIAKEVEG